MIDLWMWTGGLLMLSDFVESTPHAHMALQVAIGIDATVRVRWGGRWHEVRGAVVDTDVEHAFDGSAGLHAVLHVDAETATAAHLRDALDGRGSLELDPEVAAAAAAELRFDPADADCREVRKRFHSALARITGHPETDPAGTSVDERLLPVIERLHRLDEPTPPVAELAELSHLSESYFQHLFRDEMGMPVTRYALWQRMLAAGERLAEGASATEAAHDAGFADSAHLAREFRRFNGQTPTSLGLLEDIFTRCDEPRSLPSR